MENKMIISELRRMGTAKLVLLSFLTYGVYAAHYIKRQSSVINRHVSGKHHVPEWFIVAFLCFSYADLLLFICYLAAPVDSVAETRLDSITDITSSVWNMGALCWAFLARNALHIVLKPEKGSAGWMNALWTFLLTTLYFNFKINKLSAALALDTQEPAPEPLDPPPAPEPESKQDESRLPSYSRRRGM